MNIIKSVTPEQVSRGETKSGTNKNGKPWTLYPVGIKIGDNWYNGSFFNEEEANNIKANEPVILFFFQEEYNGKTYPKFRIPSDMDKWKFDIESRLKALEDKKEPPNTGGNTGGFIDGLAF